jgi:acetoin:2,6-dichlorophenolindophenol oxidoreductase subunit alpha
MAEVVKREIDPTKYDKDFLVSLYREMIKQRSFDQNLIRLLHEGKVSGFYHSGMGQEATGAGTCASLRGDDYILYDHRGCNQMIAKGVPLEKIYGDFLGRLCGTTCGLGAGIVHVAYPEKGVLGQSGTLGACFVIAAGVGYAIKVKKTDQVCVCYFGDGTAARETFHGGMNWAGLYNLPIVFYCENNEYGISTHYTRAHALKDNIADRADGYGIPGYVIDGNDLLLVYEVAKEAIERARAGGGPTFIEGKTFRHRGHFEGDPALYRDEAVVEEWKEKRDPIVNYRAKLVGAGVVSQEDLASIDSETEKEILDAIAAAEQSPMPECDRLYEGLYAGEVV